MQSKIQNGFQLVTMFSLMGLGAIALLVTAKATGEHGIWANTERSKRELQSQVALETARAQTAKEIADTYTKNAIAQVTGLIVNDYTLNNTPPRIDWQHTVDPTKKTTIYDRYRQCVGYAFQGRFYFVKYYSGVCN